MGDYRIKLKNLKCVHLPQNFLSLDIVYLWKSNLTLQEVFVGDSSFRSFFLRQLFIKSQSFFDSQCHSDGPTCLRLPPRLTTSSFYSPLISPVSISLRLFSRRTMCQGRKFIVKGSEICNVLTNKKWPLDNQNINSRWFCRKRL